MSEKNLASSKTDSTRSVTCFFQLFCASIRHKPRLHPSKSVSGLDKMFSILKQQLQYLESDDNDK